MCPYTLCPCLNNDTGQLWVWVSSSTRFLAFSVFQYALITMHICLQLDQVLQLAASLFVLHFVLDMPIWWVDRCPGCGNWTQYMALELCMPDEYYCYNCWDDWFEKKWARTRDCMLMLATKSLQDNPKSDVPYSSKKAYGIHCSAWW